MQRHLWTKNHIDFLKYKFETVCVTLFLNKIVCGDQYATSTGLIIEARNEVRWLVRFLPLS